MVIMCVSVYWMIAFSYMHVMCVYVIFYLYQMRACIVSTVVEKLVSLFFSSLRLALDDARKYYKRITCNIPANTS